MWPTVEGRAIDAALVAPKPVLALADAATRATRALAVALAAAEGAGWRPPAKARQRTTMERYQTFTR